MADEQPNATVDQPKKDAPKKDAKAKSKVYYHNYFCPSLDCLKAANPTPGAMHQRGVHSTSDKELSGVECPGCGGEMKICRNGHVDELDKAGKPTGKKVPHAKGHVGEDKDGNGVMYGDPVIHEAPGQEAEDAE